MSLITDNLPKFDLPIDFVVGDDIYRDILSLYSHYPCKIKCAVFVLCRKGNVSATINLSDYQLGPGDFVTLLPETFIQIKEISEDVELSFAGFSYHFISTRDLLKSNFEFFLLLRENPIVHFSDDKKQFYEDYYNFLIKAFSNPSVNFNHETLLPILDIFFYQTLDVYKSTFKWKKGQLNRENEIYMEFVHLLLENYTTEHRVNFYADKLGLTFQHFCSSIKKASEMTASEIIVRILIMDAKTQLKSTHLPVKQIAMSLGFSNTSFFHKFFKKHVDLTPQEYRESFN